MATILERAGRREEVTGMEEEESPLSHLLAIFDPLLLQVGRSENFGNDSGSVNGRVRVARSGEG
jgi:hypothetical protein